MPGNSLRRDLLVRLMLPLLAVVLAAVTSAWWLAQHFSQRVLDEWLYDSAITLAKQVRFGADEPRLDVPGPAIEMFEVDVVDRIYYEVTAAGGRRILANTSLPPPPAASEGLLDPVYYDATVDLRLVRVIALRVPGAGERSVLVKVAETRNKRDQLAKEVLVATLAILAVLTVTSVVLVASGIGQSLSALAPIMQRVRGDRRGFAPLPAGPEVPLEVRPLVNTINRLLRDLSEEHATRQRFVADAAHQLRTPLAALRLQLELALREGEPKARGQALEKAVTMLSRTTHLANRLLTLSRVDQEATESAPLESIDLGRLARDVVETWVDRAIAQGVDLGFEPPPSTVTVAGREALLREAISNLIDNALAHAGAAGPVTVGVQGAPGRVYVEDGGPGIPEHERDRVLGRFYRIPGTAGEGCGLGLAIVAEIAGIHRARLALLPGSGGTGLRAELVFGAG